MAWHEILRVNDGALVVQAEGTNERTVIDPDSGEFIDAWDVTGRIRFKGDGSSLKTMAFGGHVPDATSLDIARDDRTNRTVDISDDHPTWDGSHSWEFEGGR